MFSSIQLVYFLCFLTPVKMALLPVVVVSAQDRNLKARIFVFFRRHSESLEFLSDTQLLLLGVRRGHFISALFNYYLNGSSTPKHSWNYNVLTNQINMSVIGSLWSMWYFLVISWESKIKNKNVGQQFICFEMTKSVCCSCSIKLM